MTMGELPMAEPLHPKPAPKWLDTWWPWVNGAIALLILSYGPMLYQLFRDSEMALAGTEGLVELDNCRHLVS